MASGPAERGEGRKEEWSTLEEVLLVESARRHGLSGKHAQLELRYRLGSQSDASDNECKERLMQLAGASPTPDHLRSLTSNLVRQRMMQLSSYLRQAKVRRMMRLLPSDHPANHSGITQKQRSARRCRAATDRSLAPLYASIRATNDRFITREPDGEERKLDEKGDADEGAADPDVPQCPQGFGATMAGATEEGDQQDHSKDVTGNRKLNMRSIQTRQLDAQHAASNDRAAHAQEETNDEGDGKRSTRRAVSCESKRTTTRAAAATVAPPLTHAEGVMEKNEDTEAPHQTPRSEEKSEAQDASPSNTRSGYYMRQARRSQAVHTDERTRKSQRVLQQQKRPPQAGEQRNSRRKRTQGRARRSQDVAAEGSLDEETPANGSGAGSEGNVDHVSEEEDQERQGTNSQSTSSQRRTRQQHEEHGDDQQSNKGQTRGNSPSLKKRNESTRRTRLDANKDVIDEKEGEQVHPNGDHYKHDHTSPDKHGDDVATEDDLPPLRDEIATRSKSKSRQQPQERRKRKQTKRQVDKSENEQENQGKNIEEQTGASEEDADEDRNWLSKNWQRVISEAGVSSEADPLMNIFMSKTLGERLEAIAEAQNTCEAVMKKVGEDIKQAEYQMAKEAKQRLQAVAMKAQEIAMQNYDAKGADVYLHSWNNSLLPASQFLRRNLHVL